MIGKAARKRGANRRVQGLVLFAFATMLAATAGAAQKGVVTNVPAELATAFQTISSAGPLDNIYVGVDGSTQISHAGDTSDEVFPPATQPGDYGTFVVVGDALYAPDFSAHGSTATGGLGAYTTFTPVSQSAIGGTGTGASPFTVTTVLGVGDTGLTITQVDSYVVGQESYRTDVSLTNNSAATVSAILYRAMDCYLGGSDVGYGLVTGSSVGCSINPNNTPADRIEQIVPLSGGNNYYQSQYSAVWSAIGTHLPFDNTCQCTTQLDNGAGVSWNVDVPAGGTVTRSNLTVFSPLGAQAIFVTKTADSSTATAGGADGYTISITNPNAADATITSIVDTLPNGFAYTAGSSSGATTADPTAAAQTLTWAGPFIAPAGGVLTLHFGVTVASANGTFYNQATADAGAITVAGSGPTAPVTIGGTPPPPPSGPVAAPTLGQGMLATLVLALMILGVFMARRQRR